ncbi:hypothetical protein [Streptomyces sp. WAC00263]|uniref:hypothetical protein n=1 Tax=Streptomyces sp. WAC00263 TaxID=1917422 RepID=UPI0015EF92CB|nr:hypothetical protein [Streptomyces sp. WAC00263]KAF5990801.1 hypothetical protein BOG92_001315 [Streptomyces sp. WAC00263]
MVGALALVRYAPSTSPIADLGAWPEPVHPDSSKTGPLLGSLVRAGILKIHPSSPLTAFRWAPESFEDALREAGGDLDAVPAPQLTSSFYPLAARYCAPCGPSPAKAVEQLDAHLISALDPAGMTAGQHDDLLAVARELIAEEALRYFTNRLEELHLPAAADNHHARLSEAAHKLAEHRPLGEIYNLVWRATRAAAEAAQKNPRAPRTHMSTHAINQFETHAQNAAADPEWQIKPFSEIAGQGPAAMTRALFYNVLDRGPLETSLAQIAAVLPEPVPALPADKPSPTAVDDELTVTIEWLGAYPDRWNPDDVPRALSVLKEKREEAPEWHFEGKILARGAAHLHRLYERLAPVIGAREAALAVLGATAMLVHPVTLGGASLTNGEWIFNRLSAAIFGIPDEEEEEAGA